MSTLAKTVVALTLMWGVVLIGVPTQPLQAQPSQVATTHLSPYWRSSIRQWSDYIAAAAKTYGVDPDLVAAVLNSESNGIPNAVSYVGAVGLMGIMPAGPGLEWRPSREELLDPQLNIDWGVAILAEIIRQSGGDIAAALAAYNGGWHQTMLSEPKRYAAKTLDSYGRAVAMRSGIDPDISSHWTIAVDMRQGNVPVEGFILNEKPLSGLHLYGEHTLYHYITPSGHPFFVTGYAVPLDLVVASAPPPTTPPTTATTDLGDHIEPVLLGRLGYETEKENNSNPRIILACLPSLSRLRGHLSTRWFAPSQCPSWYRQK